MLTPDNQKAILAAFDNVSKAATEIETIPRQLQPTLARLPALTAQTQRTLDTLATLSRDTSALSRSLTDLSARLQAPDGPLEQISDSAARIGTAADKVSYETMPLANDIRSAIRALNRTLDNLNERPQSLIFGAPITVPGPGESGFGDQPN